MYYDCNINGNTDQWSCDCNLYKQLLSKESMQSTRLDCLSITRAMTTALTAGLEELITLPPLYLKVKAKV